jgi:exodeoxyribonuclease III
LKLATWNVNSLAVRLPQLLDWLAANPVDALVLQETKLTDDKFPHAEIEAAGYTCHPVSARRPTTAWRCSAARRPPRVDPVKNIPGFDDEQARVIAGTVDGTPPCA